MAIICQFYSVAIICLINFLFYIIIFIIKSNVICTYARNVHERESGGDKWCVP